MTVKRSLRSALGAVQNFITLIIIPKIYHQLCLENCHSNYNKTQISTPVPHHAITVSNIRANGQCQVSEIYFKD